MPEVDNGLLIIVSGPAGSGKTTLCDRLLSDVENVQRVVTSTTRAMREGEQHGVDYYFFSPQEFEQKIAEGAFYEYAKVHQRYYGSLKQEIDSKLSDSIDLLLNVDVQGADAFRHAANSNPGLADRLVTIFIQPQSLEQLRERLETRGDDDEAEIERRMQSARMEMEHAHKYDHIIVSDSREADFARLMQIYREVKARRSAKGD